MTLKIFFASFCHRLGILCLLFCMIFCSCSLTEQGQAIANKSLGIDKLSAKEKKCKTEKKFNDCFYVFEKYMFLEEYKKASYFGECCLEILPENQYSKLFLIHLWLANVYYNMEETAKACNHLCLSFKYDFSDLIKKNNWISELGLSNLKAECVGNP